MSRVVPTGAPDLQLPVLLDLPSPRLRAYPRETVIEKKCQAMVALGLANSRMKDFFDIWLLSRNYKFEGDALARAIAATFARRKTDVPADAPVALTAAFAEDPAKRRQWPARYTRRFFEVPARSIIPLPRRKPQAPSGGSARL